MKKKELIELRKIVTEEINKRERIKQLLKLKTVLKYLELTDIEKSKLGEESIEEIIDRVLKSFKIEKTNGIYVCTRAYYMDYKICYEDTEYYTEYVPINSEHAEYRMYTDIEDGKSYRATKSEQLKESRGYPLFNEFEKDKIILNPYNISNCNGYQEVRHEFFINAINYGQAKSKRMILERYPRL